MEEKVIQGTEIKSWGKKNQRKEWRCTMMERGKEAKEWEKMCQKREREKLVF